MRGKSTLRTRNKTPKCTVFLLCYFTVNIERCFRSELAFCRYSLSETGVITKTNKMHEDYPFFSIVPPKEYSR